VKCLSYFPDKCPLESQFLTGHFLSSSGNESELISALLDGRPLLFLDTTLAGAFLPDGGGTVFVGFDSKNVNDIISIF
jgi:uncharacterized protein YaaQ